MRQKWERRNYIDIFAGPGKNQVRDTNEVLLGSPLLALTTQHPFTGYYFIDKDPSNTAALEARAMASGLGDQVKIRTGDSNNLVDWIVGDLSKAPSQALNLAFLDPEGLELHWQTVARLASVWKMDLIINYPRSGLTEIWNSIPKLMRIHQLIGSLAVGNGAMSFGRAIEVCGNDICSIFIKASLLP